jgi:hypothetical protein
MILAVLCAILLCAGLVDGRKSYTRTRAESDISIGKPDDNHGHKKHHHGHKKPHHSPKKHPSAPKKHHSGPKKHRSGPKKPASGPKNPGHGFKKPDHAYHPNEPKNFSPGTTYVECTTVTYADAYSGADYGFAGACAPSPASLRAASGRRARHMRCVHGHMVPAAAQCAQLWPMVQIKLAHVHIMVEMAHCVCMYCLHYVWDG